MTEKTIEEICDEMCAVADRVEKLKLTPDSPMYNWQQSIIEGARRYRESRKKEMGIQ